MVIVACIALSTMVSNHLVMPLALRMHWVKLGASGEVRRFLLQTRRVSICVLLLLGFLYVRLADAPDALASIGLISFAGVAQFLPSLVGGLYWRNANGAGALAGLSAGAALWAYTLFLPSFGGAFLVSDDVILHGAFGISQLRPQALFGMEGMDPLVHSLFWSLASNVLLFVLVSLAREPRPIERLQSALFVDVFRTSADAASGLIRRKAAVHDLSVIAQRILGANEAHAFFRQAAREQGLVGDVPLADDAFITQLERKLAGSIGAATARAMISEVVTLETISLDELMRMADETQRVRLYSRQLEAKSRQLEEAAQRLGEANERLTRLDREKDDFLSQVSHEVRTPMTSIRSFSEILMETSDLDPGRAQRYVRIINEESERLTRLLDSTLDLGLLERGFAALPVTDVDPELALDRSLGACEGLAAKAGVRLERGARLDGVVVAANADRLSQVFINLLSNAIKYNTSPQPWVRVSSRVQGGEYEVRVEDNGPGIPPQDREAIFSKARRGWVRAPGADGAGLGLAISWQIMRHIGGALELAPSARGACFRVTLPLAGR
jgi:signal transduction histidine kinase